MILKATNIHKSFVEGATTIKVLQGLSLEVKKGESVAIMGKSGEGKSTLLHILGTLEQPTEGVVEICGKNASTSPHLLRSMHIGFIFQAYNLLEELTTIENVLMPKRIARQPVHKGSPAYQRASDLLDQVGLSDKKELLAKKLSGGEKQRTAIARALCNDPDIILADEPTGNLDQGNSTLVQKLLIESTKKQGKSLIVATHDIEFASLCDRRLLLKEGAVYTPPI